MDLRAKVALAVATATILVAFASSCLPDLAAIPPDDASFAFRGCGDGVIEALEDGGDAGESCDPGDADVQGCSSCKITCEGTLLPNGHCYFLTGESDRYEIAVQECASQRAHVVTVGSLEEAERVRALAGERAHWVGLLYNGSLSAFGSANVAEPGVPLAPASGPCEGCFVVGADGGELPPVAELDAGRLDCVVATASGWKRAECSGSSYATICEREPPGRRASFDCIGGSCFNVAATAGEKIYFVVSSPSDPASAESSCALFAGGSLVVLRSADEREQLAREILERSPVQGLTQTYWIGLSSDAGAWTWADGVAADGDGGRPLPWGDRQPSADGGAYGYMRLGLVYDTQLAFADDPAGAPRAYICQRPPF
ncbi:MAG: hypothetical protein KF819_20720 [Labilithrix sp.]|nr:hypothetical protein [Labilithrix sp.]